MKYTVTSELDPDLYDELERERHAAGLSRSAAMRQGVEWWIAQRKEYSEERVGRHEKRHRQVMNRIDYMIGMIREQDKRQVSGNNRGECQGDPEGSPDGEHADGGAPEQQLGQGHLAEARKRARRNAR